MSISDYFENIITDSSKWNYYDYSSAFSYDRLFPYSHCYNFICDYLKKGEKGNIDCIHYLKELDGYRLQHIVSSFFLGIAIYHQCHTIKEFVDISIMNIRENEQKETNETRFYYIWMLICLFHDCGYAFEEKRILYHTEEITKVLKQLFSSKRPLTFPFSKELIKRYEKYRECKMGVVDHGIIGGAMLYRDLCDLREKMSDSEHTQLYWGEKLIIDFQYAAWTIANHNVFKTTKGSPDAYIYRFYKLDKLITDDRILHLKRHPILFFLCLVDSIEPIKQVVEPTLLNKLEIEICDDEIALHLENLPTNTRFN